MSSNSLNEQCLLEQTKDFNQKYSILDMQITFIRIVICCLGIVLFNKYLIQIYLDGFYLFIREK